MKTFVIVPAVAALGLAVGGSAAYGTVRALSGKPLITLAKPRIFLPTGPITAPLVSADGHLAGYVVFEAQLEVSVDGEADMRGRLPLLLDATTMRTFKTPMASGPDGMLPDLDVFRILLRDVAQQVYGKGQVSKVVITQASPM
jgi:hypothetical protein